VKYLMVKRCEASFVVDDCLYRTIHGLPYQSRRHFKERERVRCEEPLGHREREHHGSEDDLGVHMFSWGDR
jgi:hypothetical protein